MPPNFDALKQKALTLRRVEASLADMRYSYVCRWIGARTAVRPSWRRNNAAGIAVALDNIAVAEADREALLREIQAMLKEEEEIGAAWIDAERIRV